MNFLTRLVPRVVNLSYFCVEKLFRIFEDRRLSRAGHLSLIPNSLERRGGTITYVEWGYTIGWISALISKNAPKSKFKMLDVGCGIGRVYIASLPQRADGSEYVGIDVMERDIKYCKNKYRNDSTAAFFHLNVANSSYAPGQPEELKPWEFESDSFDLVTAISVWTHLKENDSRYYLKEVRRVLRKGGRAIITFFVLDDVYFASVPERADVKSVFYPEKQTRWIFDTPAYGSMDWLTLNWVTTPEWAIGIRSAAFEQMIEECGLRVVEWHRGSFREQRGLYFQDILIFEA